MNSLIFEKNIIETFSRKISHQTIQQCFSIFNGNRNTLPLKILLILNYISKIEPNFSKKNGICEWKRSNIHKTLNLDNSL